MSKPSYVRIAAVDLLNNDNICLIQFDFSAKHPKFILLGVIIYGVMDLTDFPLPRIYRVIGETILVGCMIPVPTRLALQKYDER